MRHELLRKGHIEGIGNGNPQSFASFKANNVHLFYGKAMVILGADFNKGKSKITAKTNGLIEDSTVIVVE